VIYKFIFTKIDSKESQQKYLWYRLCHCHKHDSYWFRPEFNKPSSGCSNVIWSGNPSRGGTFIVSDNWNLNFTFLLASTAISDLSTILLKFFKLLQLTWNSRNSFYDDLIFYSFLSKSNKICRKYCKRIKQMQTFIWPTCKFWVIVGYAYLANYFHFFIRLHRTGCETAEQQTCTFERNNGVRL